MPTLSRIVDEARKTQFKDKNIYLNILQPRFTNITSDSEVEKHNQSSLDNGGKNTPTLKRDKLHNKEITQNLNEEEDKKILGKTIESKDGKFISRSVARRIRKESQSTIEIRKIVRRKRKTRSKKKKRTYISTNYSLPWVDSSLWSTVASTLPESLPIAQPCVTRAEVESEDSKACEAVLPHSGFIRSSWFTYIVITTYSTFDSLGLLKNCKGNLSDLLSVSESVEFTIKKTNAGLPFLCKKDEPENIKWCKKIMRHLLASPNVKNLLCVFNNALDLTQKGLLQAFYEIPAVIYHRFQISAVDRFAKIKIRQVWCIPHILIIIECMFFYNLIEICKKYSKEVTGYAYSISQNNRIISRNIINLRSKRKPALDGIYYFYSLDYSKFDRTVPTWFIDIFYAISKECIRELSSHELILFDLCRLFTKYTPFIHEDEYFITGKGISSGLFITNFFDTIFNMVLINIVETLFYDHTNTFNRLMDLDSNILNDKIEDIKRNELPKNSKNFSYLVLGDDGVVYWCKRMLEFLKRFCFFLGMEVKVKNTISDGVSDIFYLGRYWDVNGIPDQTFEYISAHIIFRTKFYKEAEIDFDIKDLEVMRVLSICLPLKSGKEYLNKVFKDWEDRKSVV